MSTCMTTLKFKLATGAAANVMSLVTFHKMLP